jgi:hypothetical protein
MTSNLKDNLLKNNTGMMKFKGLLAGSISLNGYSPDVLKSGVQKYGRRGELEKCEWCAVELDLFSECGGEPIRTNNINRLIVNSCEDVGIANPMLPIYIGKYVREWTIHRNSGNGLDRIALLKMVNMICQSKKIRLLTDLKATYKDGINIDTITGNPEFSEIYQEMTTLPDTAAGLWDMFSEKDTEELSPLMDGLVWHLDNQDDRVFYYMFQILNLREQKKRCAQRFRGWRPNSYQLEKALGGRFQPEYAIWEHLFLRAEGHRKLTETLEVLFDWYTNRSEPWLYLCQALVYFVRDCDWSTSITEPIYQASDISTVYQKNKDHKLVIDEYVYDANTKMGRKPASAHLELTSKVTNEAERLLNNKYREIYHLFKSIVEVKPVTKTKSRSKKTLKHEAIDEVTVELVEDPIPC